MQRRANKHPFFLFHFLFPFLLQQMAFGMCKIIMPMLVPYLAARFIVRNSDPFAGALKYMLQQGWNKVNMLTLWPLVRTCLVTSGPSVWELLLPHSEKASGRARATRVVELLVTQQETPEDSAILLKTLVEAQCV